MLEYEYAEFKTYCVKLPRINPFGFIRIFTEGTQARATQHPHLHAFATMKDAWRMAKRLSCSCFSVGTSKACHDHYIADAQSWLLVFSEMQSNQHYVPVLHPASPPECSKVYRGQEPERLYPGLFQLLNIWSHNAFLDFLVAPEQMEGMDSRSSQVVGDAGFHFHHFCRFA